MYTWEPVFRYLPAVSANPRQSTTLCHSVTVTRSPEARSVYDSDVAMRKEHTGTPLGV